MARRLIRFPKLRTIWRGIRITLWALSKVIHLLAVSLEVVFHRRFGERYIVWFVLSSALLYCYASVSPCYFASAWPTTFPSVFVCFVGLCFFHTVCIWTRRTKGMEVHSQLGGLPWSVWDNVFARPQIMLRYGEPLLAFLVGSALETRDPALSFWLTSSAVALFIKGQLDRHRMRQRVLDTLDSRIEGKQVQKSISDRDAGRQMQSNPSYTVHAPQRPEQAGQNQASNHFEEIDSALKNLMRPRTTETGESEDRASRRDRSTLPRSRSAQSDRTGDAPPTSSASRPSKLTYTIKEAADVLGVSEKTVRRLIDRRLLRSSKGLRHILIPKKEIDRYLEETSK